MHFQEYVSGFDVQDLQAFQRYLSTGTQHIPELRFQVQRCKNGFELTCENHSEQNYTLKCNCGDYEVMTCIVIKHLITRVKEFICHHILTNWLELFSLSGGFVTSDFSCQHNNKQSIQQPFHPFHLY